MDADDYGIIGIQIARISEGYTNPQVQDAVEMCGIRFNSIHKYGSRRCNSTNYTMVKETIIAITERVDWVCGEGVFSKLTRQTLILQIYNNFNAQILSCSLNTKKNNFPNCTVQDTKLVDTDTVKYIPTHDRETFGFYKW